MYISDISCLGYHDLGFEFCHSTATNFLFIVFHIFLKIYCLGCHNLGFREVRFEFGLCSNLNPLRGSGSYIPLNLIPEPQVQNQVQTRFGRFGNQTAASLVITTCWNIVSCTTTLLRVFSAVITTCRNVGQLHSHSPLSADWWSLELVLSANPLAHQSHCWPTH